MNKIIEKVVEPSKITVGSTFLLKVKVDDSIETREAQGTNIYINDSAASRIVRLKLLGNSIQEETPTPSSPALIKSAGDAKNIYYLPEAGTSNGITYTINEDETINLSGTATANVTFPIFKTIAEANIENGSTYTFSSNQALPSGVEFRAEAYNGTSWLRHLIGSVLNSSYQVFTGTANLANATRIRHLIYIASGTTVNITNLGIQFEKGNNQSSFTPEGKGFINEIICNKNLFDKNNPKILNAFVNGNTGLLAAPTNNQKSIAVRLQANTTYTISGVERASSNYGLFDDVTLTIGTSIATQKANITNGKTTITTGNNTKWLVFLLGGGTETYGYNNVQIEVGSTETSFIQHQEQSFIIPCQQPMRSIGNVRDEFIKQDGVWYERHVFALMTLNGTDELSWSKRGSGSSSFFSNSVLRSSIKKPLSNDVKANILSDTFENKTNTEIREQTNGISIRTNGDIELYFNEISNYSVATFESWLATHNINLIYELNEPIDLECTQEQIQALESIAQSRTYESITNIYSTDETPAYLDLIYYKKEE